MSARFSLIFPLMGERGITIESFTAWIRQTLSPERFELIVVADKRIDVPPELATLLRPHDRLLSGEFPHLALQFDAGVRAARGEFVFFTEAHCLPASDCLEAMDRFLTAQPQLVGACSESVPTYTNCYEELDARTFEEGFRLFTQQDDWRKLSIHGLALRRSIYLDAGGFSYRYERFSEMLLAATLRDRGHKLGYARESIVTHHYRATLQELIDGTDEYVRSECIYRKDNPGPDSVGHSYLPEMPNPFSPRVQDMNREVARTLFAGVLGGSMPVMREAFHAAGKVLAALSGRRGSLGAAWLAVLVCRLRCWQNRHDLARLNQPYRDLVPRASRLSYARYLASQPAVDPPLPTPCQSLSIHTLPTWALYGFHGMEWMEGTPFRWTSRFAAMRMPLPRGQYRLRLITRGLRKDSLNLHAAFNGICITPIEMPDGNHELRIERSHCHLTEQTLMLICNPLQPWKQGVADHRELGLPLFAIEAQAVAIPHPNKYEEPTHTPVRPFPTFARPVTKSA
jgi:hypothetical protein